ncbi:MAG TPA: hypothetical protein VK013_08490 [Myxococcaceae bacterium]|nr:hypothetical protein [Myxococcaceae bacterium]
MAIASTTRSTQPADPGGPGGWRLPCLALLAVLSGSPFGARALAAGAQGGDMAQGEHAAGPDRHAAGRPAGEGMLLDAAVAMLGEQLITRSDLIFEARVRALAAQGPLGLSRSIDQAQLARTLETSLLGRLLAQEAERLGVPPLTEAEKHAQLAQLEAQAGGPALLDAFLTRHGADRAQLLGLIERWEQASRALDVRVRVRAQVTEAEIREAHAESGSTRPYAEERERLARELRRERSRAVAARERARLMESASIRRLAPWARADAGADGEDP